MEKQDSTNAATSVPQVPPGAQTAGGATPPKEEKDTSTEMVQVPKDQLEKLMGLVPTVEKLSKDNDALMFAADRARLQAFQERGQTPGNRTVKLYTYMDEQRNRKVILAWRKIKDEVYKAPNGAWVEDQIIEVIFEDDTKMQLPLLAFYRNTADKIKAEILEDKGDSFKVKTVEGKEHLIGKMFVN